MTGINSALRDNPSVENCLHEAGTAAGALSGAVYYNGTGERVMNIGGHEHRNNRTQNQYGRNPGGSEGIELAALAP